MATPADHRSDPTAIGPAEPVPLRRGTAEDLESAALLLAEAFDPDPVLRWCFPDPARRAALLRSFFVPHLEDALQVDGLLIAGAMAGVRLFAPAGAPAPGRTVEDRLRDLLGADAARPLTVLATLEARHPQDDRHHYLAFSAVRPTFQGRGIGTATLRFVLREADRTGTGVYVESTTPRSRRLVLRHGFRPLEAIPVCDGVRLHPSWLPPAVEGGRP
ncbi:GNAT family N-acetyltransferase [Kitasatospora phosalacinea]|uniref:GNAT family N-acetyltransferase n=1 Tax=Kitasatospora phosalacinea TaxID=2065 RepID=UPI003654B6DD